MPGPKPPSLTASLALKTVLEKASRSRTKPAWLVRRSQMLLNMLNGATNSATARQSLPVSSKSISILPESGANAGSISHLVFKSLRLKTQPIWKKLWLLPWKVGLRMMLVPALLLLSPQNRSPLSTPSPVKTPGSVVIALNNGTILN